jgi:hypothetical protein
MKYGEPYNTSKEGLRKFTMKCDIDDARCIYKHGEDCLVIHCPLKDRIDKLRKNGER